MPLQMNIDLRLSGSITLTKGEVSQEHDTTESRKAQGRRGGHVRYSDGGNLGGTWRDQRAEAMRVASLMAEAGMEARAEKMMYCGDWIATYNCDGGGVGDHHHREIGRASFCRDRLCPRCMTTRSRVLARQLKAEILTAGALYPDSDWTLLTVTTPNVTGAKLRAEIARQLIGFTQMARRIKMQKATLGWVRRLEITIGRDGLYNVHVHVLMLMHPDYYAKNPEVRRYLTQAQYQAEWAKAIHHRIDNDLEHVIDYRAADGLAMADGRTLEEAKVWTEGPLIVDVRAADKNTVHEEMAKYVAKIFEVEDAFTISELGHALKSVRTVTWGGVMKGIRKELQHTEDDVQAEDYARTCPVCGAKMIPTIQRWDNEKRDYMPCDPREMAGQRCPAWLGPPDGSCYIGGGGL